MKFNQLIKIFDVSLDKIALIDHSGNLVYANNPFINHLEYDVDEINNLKIYSWDAKIKDFNAVEYLFSIIKDENYKIETTHKTKDGKEKNVFENILKIELESKDYLMIKVIENLDKNEIQEKYNILQEKFNSIFYNNHSVMLIIHPETGKIIEANNAAEKFYGIDKETLIKNLYVYDFNVDKTLSSLKDFKIAGIKGNNTVIAKHITINGIVRDVEISASRINLRGKNLIFAIIYDITEKLNYAKEAEIFKYAFTQSILTTLITDKFGKIIFVNDAFVKNLGYEPQEALSRTGKFLIAKTHFRNAYHQIREAFLLGSHWNGELLLKKKNGELVWHSVIISSIKDEIGIIKYFLLMAEDISEKKELIKRLEIAKEESELANKHKTDFLAQLSHELRNPFHILLNFIDFITLDYNSKYDEEYQKLYQIVEGARERIKKTINLLSDMAVLNANQYVIKKEKVLLKKDILNVVQNEYNKICNRKNLRFDIKSSFDELEIITDKYCLLQILSNLVDNSVKFTSNGYIQINAEKIDHQLIIKVDDTGIGISEQFLPFVFDDFSQEDKGYNRPHPGNGLGLALVKKYCKLIGADISIDSEKHVGTTVTLFFPTS